jgi:hypothetical protein
MVNNLLLGMPLHNPDNRSISFVSISLSLADLTSICIHSIIEEADTDE